MRITGFVCKYTCSMSFDKGDSASIGRMVKEIAFWYDEQVKSICIDVYVFNGRSEEAANSLDMSIITDW